MSLPQPLLLRYHLYTESHPSRGPGKAWKEGLSKCAQGGPHPSNPGPGCGQSPRRQTWVGGLCPVLAGTP